MYSLLLIFGLIDRRGSQLGYGAYLFVKNKGIAYFRHKNVSWSYMSSSS